VNDIRWFRIPLFLFKLLFTIRAVVEVCYWYRWRAWFWPLGPTDA